MNTNTNTTPETTVTATAEFLIHDLGDGNWEVETANGTWEVTADTATPETEELVAYHLEGPTHHHGEHWADSWTEVLELLHIYGQDGRTARSARKSHRDQLVNDATDAA